MKLDDLMNHSLKENLENTQVTKVNPVSDDNGNVIKIIVEYTPKSDSRVRF